MENTKITQTITNKQPQQLLDALFWIWDAFDRSNVPFFLVGQTADDAVKQHDLIGNRVDVGIRRLEWESGGRRIIDNFLGAPIFEDMNKAEYSHLGVPVILHIYDDHECIVQTDMIRYRYEEFKIPNPISKFKEIYG